MEIYLRVEHIVFFDLCRERYSEKYLLVELADDEYRTREIITFSTLFISDILSNGTPEYLTLRERWHMNSLIEGYLAIDPIDKFFIYLHRT